MVVPLFYSVKKGYYLRYYDQNDLASQLESRNIFLYSHLILKTVRQDGELHCLVIFALFNSEKKQINYRFYHNEVLAENFLYDYNDFYNHFYPEDSQDNEV